MQPSHLPPLPRRLAVALLLAAGLVPAQAGDVEVKFIEPDKFSDAGRSSIDRERTLKSLSDYLQALGRELPAGQTLRLEVTDLDLAGSLEPLGWRRMDEVRVLRGRADWPHLNLRYTLQADGRTLKSGDAHLSDLSYMYALRGREPGQGELAYEKRMVRRWFDETFTAR